MCVNKYQLSFVTKQCKFSFLISQELLMVKLLRRCYKTPKSPPSLLYHPILLLLPCHSKTVSLSSLALLLPVLVSFKRCNKEFNRKLVNKNIFKRTLCGGFFVNLRPVFNRNVAKVNIVMWSQNWIFVVRSVISGITKYLKNCDLNVI